jgi:hypothetical protein
MKIKGYFPLRCSDVTDDYTIYEETLEELNGFDYEIIYKKKIGTLHFTVADKKSQFKPISSFNQFRFPWCDNLLIIEGELDDISSLMIQFLVEKRIRDLFILIAICKNGILDIGAEGELFIDGKHIHTCKPFIHSVDMVVPISIKIKWPKLSTLPISDSLIWWNHYLDSIDNVSKNKIGRAINAFSHLFHEQGGSDDPAKLFWALVGIEAIYVEGNSSLQEQVNKKSQIFLGERQEFKKRFSQMYDYRSRFVHGDLDFENKAFIEDNIVDDYLSEFWENRDFAISILLATLQNLIKQNRHDLDFEYKLKDI